jgi:hypothetical protein
LPTGRKDETVDAQETVTRAVAYLSPACKKPVYARNELDWRVNSDFELREVAIADLRGRRSAATLSTTGFELFDHRTEVTDFTSEAQLGQVYLPEAKAMIGALTGAPKLFATPPVWRLNERKTPLDNAGPARSVPPVRLVHADYMRDEFYRFARLHLQHAGDDGQTERWLAGRCASFTVWRVLSPPPHDCPLAFIDRRTMAPTDLVEGLAADFGTVFCTWSARHRWGYFSDMTRDEVVVFLNFDSADDALPGPPHSAFDDPTCPVDVPPRLSCETRVYAYWG